MCSVKFSCHASCMSFNTAAVLDPNGQQQIKYTDTAQRLLNSMTDGGIEAFLVLSESIGSVIALKTGTGFVTLEQVCRVRLLVFSRQHTCCGVYSTVCCSCSNDGKGHIFDHMTL